MNADFIKLMGRFGNRIHPKFIYGFLTVQLTVSALVFIFDAGIPPSIVISGWILLIVVISVRLIRIQRFDTREEKHTREREVLRLQQIEKLRRRLQIDPGHRCTCDSCVHRQGEPPVCIAGAGPGEREFRFRREDARSYCLLWMPRDA